MSVKLISVYPRELSVELPWDPERKGGLHRYTIAAAPLDGHSELEIEDAYQSNYYGENVGYRWDVINADKIAENLIKIFATGLVGQEEDGNLGPGLFIFDPEQPLKDQIAETRERQDAYFDFLLSQGEHLADSGDEAQITDDMRLAAKWMGVKPKWLNPRRRDETKECPLCFSAIDARATVCPVCTRDVVQSAVEPEKKSAPRAQAAA